MGYPPNFQAVHRKLTDNVVISSAPLQIFDAVNLGARMALFHYNGQIMAWSAFPYCPEVVKSLELLTGKTGDFNVTHLVVPNTQHTVAIRSFKEQFPNIKILSLELVKKSGIEIDYPFKEVHAEKIIGASELSSEFGITDKFITDNFEFVYLSKHKNKELVLFDKTAKIVFGSDLIYNLGISGTTSGEVALEQFSPEVGHPKGFNPHGGKSFLTRYMQPYSIVGGYIQRRLSGGVASSVGLRLVGSLDFKTIVMSHGNVIDKDAKEAFNSVFKKVIDANLEHL